MYVAVTLRLPVIVNEHVAPVPEQTPPHANVHPANGAERFNVTGVPNKYDCEQSPGQLIPKGEDDTDPDPVTDTDRLLVVWV